MRINKNFTDFINIFIKNININNINRELTYTDHDTRFFETNSNINFWNYKSYLLTMLLFTATTINDKILYGLIYILINNIKNNINDKKYLYATQLIVESLYDTCN